jgi:hypothetical protein
MSEKVSRPKMKPSLIRASKIRMDSKNDPSGWSNVITITLSKLGTARGSML